MKYFTYSLTSLLFIGLCGCSSDSGGAALSSTAPVFKVAKIIDSSTPKSETTVIFTTSITNSTNRDLRDVEIKEVCPTGSTYAGHTVFAGTYNSSTNIWSIEEFENGKLAAMRLSCTLLHSLSGQTVAVPKTEFLSPTVFDVQFSSSSDDEFTVVPISADVTTTLSVNKTIAVEKETLDYTIVAANAGPDSATNLSMNFLCPTGSTFVSNTLSSGTTYDSVLGTWTVGTILRNGSKTLSVLCQVDIGTVSLDADVTSINSNSQDSNPSDSLTTSTPATTQCNADLTGVTTYNYTGDGLTADTAFEIANPEQLVDLSDNGADDWDKEFILCQNVDFTGITTFTSIGPGSSTPFTGIFNGNGQTISNFNTNGEALFGFTQGATIKDLTFATTSFTCDSNYCAMVADQVIGSAATTILENVTIASSVTFTNSLRYAAPIIGYVNDSTASLTNVVNDGDITVDSHAQATAVDSYTGGIVGYANNAGLVFSQVTNTGDFSSDSGYIGGIVSVANLNKSSSFDQLSNTGNLTVTQTGVSLDYLGGFFGRLKINSGPGVVSMTNSSSTGNITTGGITSYNYVGGLFGSVAGHDNSHYLDADNISVTGINIDNDSVALCNYTGGIFGYLGHGSNVSETSTIANSASAAQVSGCNYTGSFGGAMTQATQVEDSTASGTVDGLSYTGGFIGASDINSSITGSDYTGTAVTGTTVVGGFAGRMGYHITDDTAASFTNCNVTNPITLTTSGTAVGGFIGTVYNSSSINTSSVNIGAFTITNSDNIGGFAGRVVMNNIAAASATINDSHVYADGITFSTSAKNSIGGFIGSIRSGGATISNSTTNFDVTGASFVGGFVGFVEGNSADASNRIVLDSNTAEGDVTCSGTQCGGFIGRALKIGTISNSTVDNSAGTLSATGLSQDYIGGFAGYVANDFIITSSSTNLDVDSLGEFVGGFAGFLEGHADITDSKVTSDTLVGDNVMGGFIGKIQCSTTSTNADGRCDILRNYTILTSITHHTPATTNTYWSGGFVVDVRTTDNDSEIYIEDNFSVVGTINTNFHGGGFIGITMLEGNTVGTGDKIYIRRNYVGAGTLQAGGAIDAVDLGGFIGLLSGSSSLHQGEMTIEDNYTALTTIDTSNFNAGSFFVGLGGFIGADESYVGSMIQRNYSSTQVISGNESTRHISGFIGVVDQPGAGYTDSNYINNFTTANTIHQSSFEASFFFGILDGTVNPTESGNYYQSGVTCLQADEVTPCVTRLTESSVPLANFQDDNSNPPLDSWDFVSVWQARTGELPALRCSPSGSVSFCTDWDANQ